MAENAANAATTPGWHTCELANPVHCVYAEDGKALKDLRDLQMEELQVEQARIAAAGKGSPHERALKRTLADLLKRDIPDLGTRLQKIRAEYAANLAAARKIPFPDALYRIHPLDFDTHPAQPVADGVFWWARTDAYAPEGIELAFLTDGLHFFGGIEYDGDPLLKVSAGAVAQFELQAARRPPSASGAYASAPAVELFGRLSGFTGFWDWLWAADDKWSKCWLITRQTALQVVSHPLGVPATSPEHIPVVLASRTEVRQLLDEENNGGSAYAFLQGFQPMPPIEFGLLNPNTSVWVHLEVRFDIQLEGWSSIGFSPERDPMGSVLLRFAQWAVQPL